MFSKTTLFAFAYLTVSALALPIRREVPQEHSHEPILVAIRQALNLDNPDNISDPVFGLLGNAAAKTGAGKITDPDCLQTATADRAFTNAKKAGNVDLMVAALQYRALERNTGSVGLASVKCTSFKPVNPEIAALSQHQDPASDGAAAANKAIVLELARQIDAVGGDPLDALKTGTFKPGTKGDTTGKGNSCDDANDPKGCIFTQNLIVFDATEAEVLAAASGDNNAAADTSAADNTASTDNSASADNSASSGAAAATSCAAPKTVTVTAAGSAATQTGAAASAATTASNNAAASGNLQTFAGALGGVTAPAVTKGGRGFQVEGSDDFLNVNAALGRSCDIQKNKCANLANSKGSADVTSVSQCDSQNSQCRAAIGA